MLRVLALSERVPAGLRHGAQAQAMDAERARAKSLEREVAALQEQLRSTMGRRLVRLAGWLHACGILCGHAAALLHDPCSLRLRPVFAE